MISGTGLLSAKTIGFSFISISQSSRKRPGPERPMKTSAPASAPAKVLRSLGACANSAFSRVRSVRSVAITPLRSTSQRCSRFAPSVSASFIEAMPAAPAPTQTMRASSMRLPCSSSALSKAAQSTMARTSWSDA